ncbi:MAG: replication protein [Candidatus Acinetobacter avistercoris]|nr:replication protein [Candidatus Acinetobacter avistercoris]
MKSNLAHEPVDPQGELVRFPKKEQKAMSKKEDGFTPLPNFICDEGYLAVLSGESIKCLVLLNRHINGFHAKNKAIGEALVMKLTGFKDKRTVRKNMAELAKFKLVQITKTLGKATTYSLTFDDRLDVQLVTSNDTGALNVVTSNDTGVVTSDVTSTSDIKCHSVKQISLNKYLNKTHTQNPPQKTQDESWKPNLDLLSSILKTTKHSQRVSEILGMVDFVFHLGNFNAHWEDKITLTENQKTRKFVSWITQEFEKSQRVSKAKPATPNRNVNDAWGAEQQYAPASDIDCGDLL